MTRRLEGCPISHCGTLQETEYDWHERRNCFVCIVDCTPLCDVACGYSPLAHTSSELKPMFERITENLAWMCCHGWFPPARWEDPVAWKRRHLNEIADYLVNFTMDSGTSWSREFDWPFRNVTLTDCNLVAHADGGTRANKSSASAWVVEAGVFIDGQWSYKPIAMSGTYFESPISSFTAETAALAECTTFVKRLLKEL